MRVVIALGGNAILKRGEPMTAANQRLNVKRAAEAIAKVMEAGHEVVITHGNGPQVGLMALQDLAYDPALASPIDCLVAETQGQIGYILQQELGNATGNKREIVTVLTQIEVDHDDVALQAHWQGSLHRSWRKTCVGRVRLPGEVFRSGACLRGGNGTGWVRPPRPLSSPV